MNNTDLLGQSPLPEGGRPSAVGFELFAPFDKRGRLVLVGGSARAKLSTVGPWVLSSNVGSRTRQG
jgi:hypothetical protein